MFGHFATNLIKKASFALYDYKGSASRNYYPPTFGWKQKQPYTPDTYTFLIDPSKLGGYSINTKNNVLGLPASKNKYTKQVTTTEKSFTHPWFPTISGTGHGPQYYPEKQNPYGYE